MPSTVSMETETSGEPHRVPDRVPPVGIGQQAEPFAVVIGEIVLEADEFVVFESC